MQLKIEIDYKRADGQASNRIIWPLGLFFWGNVWTIGAWCETREAFRIFRLDRIGHLHVLEEHYPILKGRTVEDLIKAQDESCR